MKRILIALALIASVQTAGAQNKVAAAGKAVESALSASQNAKKATQPATWQKLGKAYLDAYSAPAGNLLVGSSQQEVNLMNKEPITGTTEVTVNGESYTKVSYLNKDLYYNQQGKLAVVKVTKHVVDNPLEKAFEAYKKAAQLDTKGSKTKDITEGLKTVYEKFGEEAYNAYTLGDLATASTYFELAADASATAPFSKTDTSYYYNAGFTAAAVENYARAEKFFKKCIEMKYYGTDGDVYYKLSDVAEKMGNKAQQKQYLEEGFKAYPQSQSVLVGLINYYIASGEDSGRLFQLLADAQANEPKNASLYYVEGNARLELGEEEKAIEAYRKCAQVNPEYEFGYVQEGILFYNKAADIQKAASEEMDDAKYAKLVEEFEVAIKACVAPFEQAFNITKETETKVAIAEYLKNACYRFSEEPEYKAKYDQYKEFVEKNQ